MFTCNETESVYGNGKLIINFIFTVIYPLETLVFGTIYVISEFCCQNTPAFTIAERNLLFQKTLPFL